MREEKKNIEKFWGDIESAGRCGKSKDGPPKLQKLHDFHPIINPLPAAATTQTIYINRQKVKAIVFGII